MMRTTTLAAMLAAVVAVVLAAGCTSDPPPAAEPPPASLAAEPAAEAGSSRTEFTVSADTGRYTATINVVGAGPLAPDDAALRAVAAEFARRVGLSTDKPVTPTQTLAPTLAPTLALTLTHAQAVSDLVRSTDESPDDISHPPWLAAALAVFPVHLQPAFHAIGCAESGLTADAVGAPNSNGTRDYGWLQINSIWFDGDAATFTAAAKTDPVQSAVGALVIYGYQGLEAWSTWRGSAQATLALAHAHGNCTELEGSSDHE